LNSLRVPDAPATTRRPFQSLGRRKRNLAWPVGSEAMRAFNCTPGTTLVIGLRSPELATITPRSVVGVNAPNGSPGSELSAGVVSGFLVVRSSLLKQLMSARLPPSAFCRSAQVTAAPAENGARSSSKTA
jgi:hypothetical protein